ncbi:hypothetical protein Golob_022736 [Gossypium lobatum]|uniref:DUF4283 domain-containing protein n=1 Tax=Gossypium lobatum TaxID=34289 RepID=A0A7J8LHG0_9ROSI|nr:hypothetical protein [Gossypium lobatum]
MKEGLASLCIDEKEEEVWQIQGREVAAPISYEFCFVGSFLMTSIVNFQSMQNTIANPWHLIGGVPILELGGTFFFRFFYEIDITGLCVQVHNLPHGLFSKKMARQLTVSYWVKDDDGGLAPKFGEQIKEEEIRHNHQKSNFLNQISLNLGLNLDGNLNKGVMCQVSNRPSYLFVKNGISSCGKEDHLSHTNGKKQPKRDMPSSIVSAKPNLVGDMIDHVMTGNLNGSIEFVK